MAPVAEKVARGVALNLLLRRGLIAVLGGAGVGLSAWGLGLAWQPKASPASAPPGPAKPMIIDGPPTDVPPAPAPPLRAAPTDAFTADMDDDAGPDSPPPAEAPQAEPAVASSPDAGADVPPPGAGPAGPALAQAQEAREGFCSQLASPADRLVCVTPQLGAADLRLRRLYRQALDDTADPEGLRDDQRRWDRDRDRVAQLAGPEGLAQLYDERIQELSGPG
jgi:uncharacterized protein YecT (DUF1311 family)